MSEPTNAVLAEMINANKELSETKLIYVVDTLNKIEKHLEELNGSVAKNTKFRNQAFAIIGVFSFFSSAIMAWIISKFK